MRSGAAWCVFPRRVLVTGMRLLEIAPGMSLESLRAVTAAEFEVVDDLKEMA